MRILLVEDEKRMAEALCEILHLEKYDVDHCDKVFVKLSITLLIMVDCSLPQISLLTVEDVHITSLFKGDRNLLDH